MFKLVSSLSNSPPVQLLRQTKTHRRLQPLPYSPELMAKCNSCKQLTALGLRFRRFEMDLHITIDTKVLHAQSDSFRMLKTQDISAFYTTLGHVFYEIINLAGADIAFSALFPREFITALHSFSPLWLADRHQKGSLSDTTMLTNSALNGSLEPGLVLLNKHTRGYEVGRGSHGKVKLGEVGGVTSAVKKGYLGTFCERVNTPSKTEIAILEQTLREADIASLLPRHAYTPTTTATFIAPNSKKSFTAYTQMELLNGKPLASVLSSPEFKTSPFHDRVQICQNLLCAVSHVHSHNVIHGDVSKHNTMIDGSAIKILDFGHSARVKDTNMHKDWRGTFSEMSPECIRLMAADLPMRRIPKAIIRFFAKTKPDDIISLPHDVWGVGSLMFQILFNTHPFLGSNVESLSESSIGLAHIRFYNRIKTGTLHPDAKNELRKHPEFKPLFDKIFTHHSTRISIEECVQLFHTCMTSSHRTVQKTSRPTQWLQRLFNWGSA